MNTTPPLDRDLPPGRHAEIRAAVVRAAGRPARTRLLAPVLAAVAVLVAIGVAVWFVPADDTGRPAATATPNHDEIVRDCVRNSGMAGEFRLRQLITDEAGRFAVLYSGGYLIQCDVDSEVRPYDAGMAILQPFTPPISLDSSGAVPGGDVPGGEFEHQGIRGWEYAVGRVAPEVARVTVTLGRDTVDASIAGGTFVVRVLRPVDWVVTESGPPPVARAYDANGKLLAEVGGV